MTWNVWNDWNDWVNPKIVFTSSILQNSKLKTLS